MSAFDHAVVVAVPVAYAPLANAMMIAAGYASPGDTSHQVPVSASGAAPATHLAWWNYARAGDAALLMAETPPELGLDPAEALLAAAMWEMRVVEAAEVGTEGINLSAWVDVQLAAHGLARIPPEVE